MQNLLILTLLVSLNAVADVPPKPAAKVEKVVGTVLFNGKEIHEGESLSVNGMLQTQKRSFLRIRMDVWSSSIIVGPDTQMNLDLTSPKTAKPERYQLKEGFCRWISAMRSTQMKGSHVFTKSAALGVRGTDFEILNRAKTGETEVIVFDGEVLLKSNLADSEALIKKGQWGGVGGKFGATIAKLKDLSPGELKKAKERSEALAVAKQASKSSGPDSDSY
ncbi:MAG: FecR domain-containing protein [Bdellovibrionota bacterium]